MSRAHRVGLRNREFHAGKGRMHIHINITNITRAMHVRKKRQREGARKDAVEFWADREREKKTHLW